MKKAFFGLIAALLASMALASCEDSTSSTTEVAYTNHCAIKNVILGQLNRRVKTQTRDGRDTTYTTIVPGSLYAFYIDQLNNEIYNPDSLPVGTDNQHVVFANITADGAIGVRNPWGTDTIYNQTDSLDFTSPRIMTCYAYSGEGKKEYTVHVNVHQVDPEVFQWFRVDSGQACLASLDQQRSFIKDSLLCLFATRGSQAVVLQAHLGDIKQWTETPLDFPRFKPDGVKLFKGRYYYADGGKVMTSDDGLHWTDCNANITATAIAATDSRNLWAIADGNLWRSADGTQWTPDNIDGNADKLPAARLTHYSSPMSFNQNFEYIILGGTCNGQTVEWKKVIDHDGNHSEAWTLYNMDDTQNYGFPDDADLQAFNYDGHALALGCKGDTLSKFYLCRDAGRTWVPQKSRYIHPWAIKASAFSVTADEQNYIWIVCSGTGELWRGRINRLGFETSQKAFE